LFISISRNLEKRVMAQRLNRSAGNGSVFAASSKRTENAPQMPLFWALAGPENRMKKGKAARPQIIGATRSRRKDTANARQISRSMENGSGQARKRLMSSQNAIGRI